MAGKARIDNLSVPSLQAPAEDATWSCVVPSYTTFAARRVDSDHVHSPILGIRGTGIAIFPKFRTPGILNT